MGDDEAALAAALAGEARRGRAGRPVGQSASVQLGVVTEDLNRRWYEANSGQVIADVQRHDPPSDGPALAGRDARTGALRASGGRLRSRSSCCPGHFSEEAATAKYAPQLQHNMWVVAARGGGAVDDHRGREVGGDQPTHADPLYQHLIVTAERKFWRCVENGETSSPVRRRARRAPRIEAVRIVDMSASNAWAEFATSFARTHPAFLRSVEIHREFITAAARWMMAAKL